MYRILVVDDEPIVGKRLQQVFQKMGYEVEIYTSSAEALEAIGSRPFDVVVTDLKMEGIDGMEVLARVRKANPATSVIIITGYPEQKIADEAFERGVFELIPKPFRLEELKQAVLRALNATEAAASASSVRQTEENIS